MTPSPVRIAIVGFGHHAVRRLLPSFVRSTETRLVGMWRRNQTAAAEDCARHGIEHCFRTREELCSSPEVDAVFITSPDAMHLADALLAISHGKAVLCEKPMGMNAGEAEAMVSAAKAADIVLGIAQNFRFNRSVEFMREKVGEGLIGQPQLAQAHFCYPAQNAPRTWIADGSLACGGPIGDVGVHCVDALRYILRAEALNVSTLATKDELSGDVEAYAAMQMEMTGGVYASVVANARTPYRSLLEVIGSDGVLTAENGFHVDRPVEVAHWRNGQLLTSTALDNGDGYVRMLDGFAAAVQGKAEFAATGEDGIRNMRVVDAAYRSWHSGKREPVATAS